MSDIPKKENPQPSEKMDDFAEELFQKVKEQNITVDPVVWTLLTHVLGNRIYCVNLILGDLMDTPKWILKTGSFIMSALYKITGGRGPMINVNGHLERAMVNTDMIKNFLSRLRAATYKKPGF
jgi:hypothetical protein